MQLKPYIYLMEAEGLLKKNTTSQWLVVTALLEPFVCAQRLLEGECYIIVSVIAFIIWKIRKGLLWAIESPERSVHID